MTSIGNLTVSNDEERNRQAKAQLYKSAIVGFEKLRVRKKLDLLDNVTDVLSPAFQAIFASVDDIEESHYLDITRSRLGIIDKFEKEIVDAEQLEKVAQKYLFDHLWLLDPTWGRVSGSEQMEITLTEYLKRVCPDSDEGARLDIAYRLSSGRHVVIELKRPGKRVRIDDLESQGRKYYFALKQYHLEYPDVSNLGGPPAIDIYLLVSECPPVPPEQQNVLRNFGMQVITYSGLIINARKAYQEYLSVRPGLGRLERVFSEIDNLHGPTESDE